MILAALFYTAAGIFHFLIPGTYLRVMPAWVPVPLPMIYFTGLAEAAGGVGLLLPYFRRWASYGLIVLLIGVFPVNVKMALESSHFLLWLRLPVQGLLIWWAWRCGRAQGSVVS